MACSQCCFFVCGMQALFLVCFSACASMCTYVHVCPLQLHEHSYRPLKPADVVLPPPTPPTDHLIKAVEEFYKEDTEGKRNE